MVHIGEYEIKVGFGVFYYSGRRFNYLVKVEVPLKILQSF